MSHHWCFSFINTNFLKGVTTEVALELWQTDGMKYVENWKLMLLTYRPMYSDVQSMSVLVWRVVWLCKSCNITLC